MFFSFNTYWGLIPAYICISQTPIWRSLMPLEAVVVISVFWFKFFRVLDSITYRAHYRGLPLDLCYVAAEWGYMIRSGYFNGVVYNLLHAFVLPSARLFDISVLDSLRAWHLACLTPCNTNACFSIITKDRCGEEIETKMGKLTEEQNNGDIKAFLKGYDRILATGGIGLRHDYLEEDEEVKICRVVLSSIFSWMLKRQSGNQFDGLCTPRDVAVIYGNELFVKFCINVYNNYNKL